jgi:hypothetical protein
MCLRDRESVCPSRKRRAESSPAGPRTTAITGALWRSDTYSMISRWWRFHQPANTKSKNWSGATDIYLRSYCAGGPGPADYAAAQNAMLSDGSIRSCFGTGRGSRYSPGMLPRCGHGPSNVPLLSSIREIAIADLGDAAATKTA